MDLYVYVGNDPINRVDPTGLIIKVGNANGQQLLFALNDTAAGAELLNYLQASPIEYTVYASPLAPDDPAGQFGLLEDEETTCSVQNDRPRNQNVRVNTTTGLAWAELVATLGHELGHAALYDNFFLGRPGLPSFIDPAWNNETEPGGMNGFAHFAWSYKATELFQ